MATAVLPSLLKLPKRKRMELAESLWLSVADDSMNVPADHKEILSSRLKSYRAGALQTVSSRSLIKRLRSRE